MDSVNEIISANLVKLRKSNKLTQTELAEKIHYSDKSISKWETGESCPSIAVALEIAKFYGITLDDLVDKDLEVTEAQKEGKAPHNYSYVVITMLACSVVWLIATIVFIYGLVFSQSKLSWLSFVTAVPVTCIILLVFNSIWGNRRNNYVILSVFTWTLLATVFLYMAALSSYTHMIWVIFILGIPVQISIILWSQLKQQTLKDKFISYRSKFNGRK